MAGIFSIGTRATPVGYSHIIKSAALITVQNTGAVRCIFTKINIRGGAIGVVSGSGVSSSSGGIVIRSGNAVSVGSSGGIVLSSGTTGSGSTGDVVIASGS